MSEEFRLGFFRRRVTCANLREEGKHPSVKDRLARVVIMGAKMDANDLRTRVERKLIGEVILAMDVMSFNTLV